MKNVITGISSINEDELDTVMATLNERTRTFRYVHDIERLTIAVIERLLMDADIKIPAGNDNIGIYIGIDNAIESVKEIFFSEILKDGILGASPLLFPFTSPNALAAQATILFDIRGESVVMPVNDSISGVMDHADEAVSWGYMDMAIAGGVSAGVSGGFQGDFCFVESSGSADNRGVRIYDSVPEIFI